MSISETHTTLDVCEECHKPDIVVNNVEGTVSCTWCGLVQQSRIID
jgi:transcription initiation factor TFIIIB Brf1 subunit/transcription initiation factor TFIIB